MWDVLLDAFFPWLHDLAATLPTCPDLGFDLAGLGGLSGYMGSVGLFIDLPALTLLLSVVLTAEVSLRTWRLGVWVYEHLPFVQ